MVSICLPKRKKRVLSREAFHMIMQFVADIANADRVAQGAGWGDNNMHKFIYLCSTARLMNCALFVLICIASICVAVAPNVAVSAYVH